MTLILRRKHKQPDTLVLRRARFNLYFLERAHCGKVVRMKLILNDGRVRWEHWVLVKKDDNYLRFRRATFLEAAGDRLKYAFYWWLTGGHPEQAMIDTKIKQ